MSNIVSLAFLDEFKVALNEHVSEDTGENGVYTYDSGGESAGTETWAHSCKFEEEVMGCERSDGLGVRVMDDESRQSTKIKHAHECPSIPNNDSVSTYRFVSSTSSHFALFYISMAGSGHEVSDRSSEPFEFAEEPEPTFHGPPLPAIRNNLLLGPAPAGSSSGIHGLSMTTLPTNATTRPTKASPVPKDYGDYSVVIDGFSSDTSGHNSPPRTETGGAGTTGDKRRAVTSDFQLADIVEQVLAKKSTMRPKKLKRKSGRGRTQTTQSAPVGPIIPSAVMGLSVTDDERYKRRNTLARIKFLQDNIKTVSMLQPKKVIKNLAPTKIPAVRRFIDWASEKWPGHSKYKYVLESPFFFLYIISMSLVQALLSAVVSQDYELAPNWSLAQLVSICFFVLYILEVMFRMFVKGFDFFLSFYNMIEVGLTFTAFMLDLLKVGNVVSLTANVLSLRIIWVIHKVPGIRFVVGGIRLAAPRLFIILFPLIILIYVFAVIATSTLGPNSFEYPSPDYWKRWYRATNKDGVSIAVRGADLGWDYYGDIAKSMYTLFQVMTGDGWSENIARPTMAYRPWSFILFIVFYSLFAFVLLNIFTGIMVDAIQSYEKAHSQNQPQSTRQPNAETLNSVPASAMASEETLAASSSESLPSMIKKSAAVSKESIQDDIPDIKHAQHRDIYSHSDVTNSTLVLRELLAMREEMTRLQSRMMLRFAAIEARLSTLPKAETQSPTRPTGTAT